MRDQTEWVELIDNKVNVLVGADKNLLIDSAKEMLKQSSDFNINLYGNGKASSAILNTILAENSKII